MVRWSAAPVSKRPISWRLLPAASSGARALVQAFPVDERARQAAMWPERVVRYHPGQLEPQPCVKSGCAFVFGGIEHQQPAAARKRHSLGFTQQDGSDAAVAMTEARHHFRDL